MHIAHETAGAARTRSSLRPLYFGGKVSSKTSGASRRENAMSCSDLSTSLRGAKRPKQSILSLRREMGCFACARNDDRESGLRRDDTGGILCEAIRPVSLRLLRQIRMRPAEIRRSRILADLDDAAADGAGAGKMFEQRFAVVAADGAGEFRKVLV